MELVIRKHNHRHRRVPEIIRQFESEPVVVNKNRVQIFIKQLSGHIAFKFVEPQIQELERRKLENDVRKLPGEPIITEIQFVKQLETVKFVRYSAAESVGVDVEQCKIRK